MDPDEHRKQGHLRDISLMIFGALLVRDKRDEIMGHLPVGVMPKEFELVIQGIRDKKYIHMSEFLKYRGVEVANGHDAVLCLIDKIIDEAKRSKAKQMLGQLRHALGGEDIEHLKQRLKDALLHLEEL